MQWWKKYVLVGISAGTTMALLTALGWGGYIWYSGRPVPWNDRAFTVVWSEARQSFNFSRAEGKGIEFEHAGFSLDYGLRNTTSTDILLSDGIVIMKRMKRGRTLVDYSHTAKPYRKYFVPAGQTAEFSFELAYGCSMYDAAGTVVPRDIEECFREALDDCESFLVLDHRQRLQIELPAPKLKHRNERNNSPLEPIR